MRTMFSSHRVAALLAVSLLAFALPARAETDFLGKKSADWLKELSDPKSEVRRGAAFALGKCGAAGAVPQLLRALDDADAQVREAAAYSIGEIAAERKDPTLWRTAGSRLRKLLAEEKEAKAQRSAACAIGQFGPDAADARAELEQALNHKDAAVRQNAAWALGRLKEKATASGVGRLSAALSDDDAAVRRDAAAALGDIGRPTARPALRSLIKCLIQEKEEGVRSVAVGSLVSLVGPEDKEVAGDLRELLEAKDREVKRGAALALANLGGSEGKPALPVLLDALTDNDATARELAAAALAHLGEAAGEAVPALGKALSDRSPEVRRNAALALSRVGPRAGEAVRPLVRALDVQEPAKVRRYAAEALSHAPAAAVPVVPDLLPFIKKDHDPEVRQRLVRTVALGKGFEGSEAEKVLEMVLHETDSDNRVVRYDTARVLAYALQDRAPAKAVAVLVEMLDDTKLLEYRGTDSTLKKGDESVKSGTGARENLGGDARYMAAEALADIARSGKRSDARDALRTAAESKDEVKKKVARDALKAIGLR
jgi:HEAT repeat protein